MGYFFCMVWTSCGFESCSHLSILEKTQIIPYGNPGAHDLMGGHCHLVLVFCTIVLFLQYQFEFLPTCPSWFYLCMGASYSWGYFYRVLHVIVLANQIVHAWRGKAQRS